MGTRAKEIRRGSKTVRRVRSERRPLLLSSVAHAKARLLSPRLFLSSRPLIPGAPPLELSDCISLVTEPAAFANERMETPTESRGVRCSSTKIASQTAQGEQKICTKEWSEPAAIEVKGILVSTGTLGPSLLCLSEDNQDEQKGKES